MANLINIYAHKLRLYGRNIGYFPVRYDSRVVIYEHTMFIRVATVVVIRLHDGDLHSVGWGEGP